MRTRNQVQAVALVGVLETTTVEPTPFHLRSASPVYHHMASRREPLDLSASMFRYRKLLDGSIQPVRDYALIFCRCGASAPRR
jgi:hypothetical protein